MAGAPAALLRLLPLLLLLLPSGLREHLSPAIKPNDDDVAAASVGVDDELLLHPIVLVPGASCSKLDARLTEEYNPSAPRCGAMKGKGWFGLWDNSSDVAAHHYLPCFLEQMSLVYDPAADDYHNLPGVETRVPHFGSSSRGFITNPDHPDWCLATLRRELESVGYRDGETLFGAPYDLRHAPPPPGRAHASRVYSRYFRQLTGLIEDASRKNNGRKVILFGHSFGGMVALEFVASTPMAWRRRHLKHLVLVAPLPPAAGYVEAVRDVVSGPRVLNVPTAGPLSLRPMWRTFESAIVNFPSLAVFGDRPLVVTDQRNYSAYDMEELVAAIGFGDGGVQAFRSRWPGAAGRMEMDYYFPAPMVPTTCINAVGVDTPEQLVYRDGDLDVEPEIIYGDGDETINLISMLAFDEEMRQQPGQARQFKSVKRHGATHSSILTEIWALQRVVQEILEAN